MYTYYNIIHIYIYILYTCIFIIYHCYLLFLRSVSKAYVDIISTNNSKSVHHLFFQWITSGKAFV